MLLTSLPFDYAVLFAGDRVRTKSARASGTRIRRAPARDKS
jgi:hypothetical protein